MRQMKWLWLALILAALLGLGVYAAACGDDDDNDNDDGGTEDDDSVDDDDNDNDDNDSADDDSADDDDDDDNDTPDICETIVVGHLEWAQCDNGADISQYDAITYAETLELDGKTDWRLPTRAELIPLYDEDTDDETDCYLTAHIHAPFNLSCVWVWTSEVSEAIPEIAWVVGFSQGTVVIDQRDTYEKHRALAVRDLPD
ncbi:MAG: DUF1566 domain-containing protein [Myxococcales bacterium]|nr:DUF1566 domain-containing protein [Myxococcales bacterium]